MTSIQQKKAANCVYTVGRLGLGLFGFGLFLAQLLHLLLVELHQLRHAVRLGHLGAEPIGGHDRLVVGGVGAASLCSASVIYLPSLKKVS